MVWVPGATKTTAVGEKLAPKVVPAAVTCRITTTDCGVLPAPGAVIVTRP